MLCNADREGKAAEGPLKSGPIDSSLDLFFYCWTNSMEHWQHEA